MSGNHAIVPLRARDPRAHDGSTIGFGSILGVSPAIQDVIRLARRVVDSPTTVLLEGPTGSGKDLVARAIHHEGPRCDRPFVPVNCGAISETLITSELFGYRKGGFTGADDDRKGLFEVADGGTLFLDEISETSPALQVHLLRALQDGEIKPVGAARPVRVDVRVIAATNRDLTGAVRKGRFREDLYFRLNVFRIRIPALAERREDVALLARHFLRKHAPAHTPGLDTETIEALTRCDFPGNVRELEHMIERAVLLADGDAIRPEDLVGPTIAARTPPASSSLEEELQRFERDRIVVALERCGGNRTHAASDLGVTYRGLLKKMHRHGLIAARATRA